MGTPTTDTFNQVSDKAALENMVAEVVDVMQATSLQGLKPDGTRIPWHRSKEVDWQKLREKAMDDIRSVEKPTVIDACGAIDRALMRLGDRHSLISHPQYQRTIRADTVEQVSWQEQKEKLRQKVETTGLKTYKQFMPKVKYLNNGEILYVAIPGFDFGAEGANREAYQNKIRDALLEASKKNVKGVVVDLRNDIGGSMCPMIWGLSPLLGPGTVGHFTGTDGDYGWNVNYGTPKELQLDLNDPSNFPLTDKPVAVLCGDHTCSSGEAAFLSLSGRARSYSFGGPTFGNSSGNGNYFPAAAPGLSVHICGAITTDRNGKGDGGPIQPDVPTPEPLQRAVAWINDGAPQLNLQQNGPKRQPAPV